MKGSVSSALVAIGLVTFLPSRAFAVDRDACAVPYEQAQLLRKRSLFLAAEEQLQACVAQCPTVLAADCSKWSAELKALTPTVVARVRDAEGRAIESFRVSVNGVLLGDAGGDAALPVDPGDHLFRFEAPGFAVAEVRATLNEGEHRRVVEVTLVPLVARGPAPRRSTDGDERASAPQSHALAYTLVAIGAAGLATGGGLSIAGFVDRSNLRSTCAPGCSASSVDAIQSMWIAGGIAAGVGVVSLAVGTGLWVRPSRRPATALRWAPVVGVSSVGVRGEF